MMKSQAWMMKMKNKQIFRGLASLAGIVLCTVSFSAMAAQLRVIQTNFAGDTIHVVTDVLTFPGELINSLADLALKFRARVVDPEL